MTLNNKTIETLLEIERITVWNAAIETCVGRLKKEFIAPEVVIELIRKEKKDKMHKPSSILTMTRHDGKTHVQIEEEFNIEQKRRLMEFMISPVVKEITKEIGEKLMTEYYKNNLK